ncbi:PAS domain-containing protein [Methylobacterium sp. NEAU 140]|uniref:PAS domain-containing protein n=1 Tax=Methylobacterium sp. NEAU 140 TaxID=3064945 RepID=UPI0027350618|nr:PAS domain-containing protein [Methylobacterium sp. NEAU 140]MDP4021484.1 PAS domain-containing protein [Methylobacterium sp. NEAU 140]
MIFTTEASGVLTYVGPEWEALTGQDRHAALGEGWLACLDSEDGAILRGALAEAARTRAEFTVRFRLRRVGGVSIWAVAGAVPSYGPPDTTFLGFLGSITEIAPTVGESLAARASIGRFVPPPQQPSTLPGSALDLVADHLLIAHSLIEADGGKSALPALREALFRIGQEIARKEFGQSGHADADRIH